MSERWQERAACRGKNVDLWFSDEYHDMEAAKAVCHGCPVRATCLTENLFEPYGVFGGKSPKQRSLLRVGVKRPYREWASCAGCVNPFRPTSARQIYCSDNCRKYTSRERRMLAEPIEGEVA